MKLRDANLQVNLFHVLNVFCLHFLRIHNITFSGEPLKVCEHNFFQEIQAESSNLPVQLRFI